MAGQAPRTNIRSVFDHASRVAEEFGHEYITLEHLLLALTEVPEMSACFDAHGVKATDIAAKVKSYFHGMTYSAFAEQPRFTAAANAVINLTMMAAILSSKGAPTASDLLIQILMSPAEDSYAVTLLMAHGFSALSVKKFATYGSIDRQAQPTPEGAGPGMGAGSNAGSTPDDPAAVLAKYTVNLNEQAKASKVDPLIGRTSEVAEIVRIMARRSKNNAVMVGEPGVGKTAIAEGLALKIVRGEVPKILADSTVYALDIGNLVAGTRYRGDFEERMKQVLAALDKTPGAIVFIDEIHTIMGAGAGSQSSLDVANLLKPALAKGNLRCIGATTLEEFRKHFEKDRALLRRFKRVDIGEPSVEDAKLILRGLKETFETYHGVTFTDEAVDAAVDLANRYITAQKLPDKAIDLLDVAGATQRVRPDDERESVITASLIKAEVARIARIPDEDLSEDDSERMRALKDQLRGAVYGQDDAIDALTKAVRVARAGLREPNKPTGSYLFVGPTGVGKTEAAKQLAASLGVPLLRYDMSEYMEKHSVARLIGAPPGYVGYGEGDAGNGKLVNDIDQHPRCVLLLDEIEKAHPDVFNILLQVMDDGRLTNSAGKTVDFRNVIIILTSNAGARDMSRKAIGFGGGMSAAPEAAINATFSPEFRNRLDAIVRFNALSPDMMGRIVEKFVADLSRLASRRNVTLTLTAAAREWLAREGYDVAMGARPLGRLITETIKGPLSEMMLFGSLKDGGNATIDVIDGKLVIA